MSLKRFSLLLCSIMVLTLVLSACGQAAPAQAPEQARQVAQGQADAAVIAAEGDKMQRDDWYSSSRVPDRSASRS